MEANLGSLHCWFSDQFCTIMRSWRSEEICTADSSKDMEMYEALISSVFEVLREGRRGGAREFYITRDLNVGVGNDVYFAHQKK